jgi:hypothetical protein
MFCDSGPRFEPCRPWTRGSDASPGALIASFVETDLALDASGMLWGVARRTGEPADKVGDTLVLHMDRESLNGMALGKYDMTVHVIRFERDKKSRETSGPTSPLRTSMSTA